MPSPSLGVLSGHELSMALRRAYLRLHRQTNAACSDENLTADQFVLLNALKSAGKVTQAELVLLINSDANTVSAMVRRLQKKELLQRSRHEKDNRAIAVSLTPAGLQHLEILEERTAHIRRDMEAEFSRQELDQLVDLLNRLTEVDTNPRQPQEHLD